MRLIKIYDDKFSSPMTVGVSDLEDREIHELKRDVLKKHMLEVYGILDAPIYSNSTRFGEYALDDEGDQVFVGWEWVTNLDDPDEYSEQFAWHIKKEKELRREKE